MDERDTILIINDNAQDRASLCDVFRQRYKVLESEGGGQASLMLEQFSQSLAAVLVDLSTATPEGEALLRESSTQTRLKNIPILALISGDAQQDMVHAFDLGAVDVVLKPFEPHVTLRRVENIVDLFRHKSHLEELVEVQANNLLKFNESVIDGLSTVIEYRSVESGQHVLRIRMFTKILLHNVAQNCPEYNLDERSMERMASAAALHDIGKIAIPDAILNKPGRLTPEEFEIMKTHAVKGCEILESLGRMEDLEYLQYAYSICRYHHERWNGGGYPEGLKGDNIPVGAQVVGIADAYDALTTDRVYKKAYPHEKAMNMILNGECGGFSPKLLECLKNVKEQFSALAAEYADGVKLRPDSFEKPQVREVVLGDETDTTHLAQQKYFALLKYENSAVLELDADTHIYHMVYTPDGDFDLLRTGDTFENAFANFAAGSVHPDDRQYVMATAAEYLRDFFEAGRMKQSRSYRVLHRSDGSYRRYRATLLRVDTETPRRHRAMIIWHGLAERQQENPTSLALSSEHLTRNMPGGGLQCCRDARYTVAQINEGFTTLLGYTAADLRERLGNGYLEIIHPDDRKAIQQQVEEQLRSGNTIEVEYRARCKDGTVIWILEKGRLVQEQNMEYIYCFLIDITQTKRAQEELRLSLERHKIIMDQTNDIIFEWDSSHDKLNLSPNWVKKFGYAPITEHVRERIPGVSHIHPSDCARVQAAMGEIFSGTGYVEVQFRIATAESQYIWCRARATAQFGENGKLLKAVGVILDIDQEMRRAEQLKRRAEQDALTKLYNKAAAMHLVEQNLAHREEGVLAAMFIIDVDNFKQVNDRYGHLFGDAVLAEIAAELQVVFHSAQVISRIGGDEFLAFWAEIPNPEFAETQAGKVIRVFQRMFQQSFQDCRLSCSIGISFAPTDGTDLQSLFQRADRALYMAKLQGKNQCLAYTPSMERPLPRLYGGSESAISARIDSDDQPDEQWRCGLLQYAFRILSQAKNVTQAVQAILEMVGRQYNVSRTYIFEDLPDGTACRNTFEWCNNGITPQLDRLQNLSYQTDLGGAYQDNFDENGIFYCRDVQALPATTRTAMAEQPMKSMLQCAIRDNGKFRGFVGFDECASTRLWTKEQIGALTFLSELLTIFLLKKRAQDCSAELTKGLYMALDNQNSYIYVIDPDTYEMYYVNKKTAAALPDCRVGMRCHQVFFQREEPCQVCPARDIRRKVNGTLELYNPKLKLWTEADAALIQWAGKDACMLTCHDITRFKPGE